MILWRVKEVVKCSRCMYIGFIDEHPGGLAFFPRIIMINHPLTHSLRNQDTSPCCRKGCHQTILEGMVREWCTAEAWHILTRCPAPPPRGWGVGGG